MKGHQEDVVVVRNLYKSFRLPHEQTSGLKQTLLNFFRQRNEQQHGYEIQRVLSDVSFEIKKGEFFGIVGRNGSGKSTLLKLLAGIYTPDKGIIQVNGSLTPFIELGVGFNPELTGKENIFMNGALLGFSHKEMEDMYDDIVTFSELERFMDQKLKNYSSGMQVRLAFSIAVKAQSDILLIDEVLAVGDEAFQRKCFEYFELLKRKKNTTVVFITHDMHAVNRFCDRAILIENGKIKRQGRPRDIADQYKVDNLDGIHAGSSDIELPKEDVKVTLKNNVLTKRDSLEVEIKYNSKQIQQSHYAAISLLFENRSFAELNSLDKPVKQGEGKGKITFTMPVKTLNPGTYEITAAIFDTNDKTLLQYASKGKTFVVGGYDHARGAPMRIDGEWGAI